MYHQRPELPYVCVYVEGGEKGKGGRRETEKRGGGGVGGEK